MGTDFLMLLALHFFIRKYLAGNRVSALLFFNFHPPKSERFFLLVFSFAFPKGQMVILTKYTIVRLFAFWHSDN